VSDESISERIRNLVAEEHRLYEQHGMDELGRKRIKEIEVELDVCWDLLRQRRAKREFGDDPDEASARASKVVEGYIG
jgi:Protein of unknown function (DUF2630)